MRNRSAGVLGVCFSLTIGVEAQEPSTDEMGFNLVGSSFVAMHVEDDSAAAGWYESVFGLEEVSRLEAQDGRYSIRILTRPGLSVELTRISGSSPSPDGPQLGLFKAGVFVDDIERAFAWLRSKDVDTDRDIFTDPALQVRSFVFSDSEGNRLQVFEQCAGSCGPRQN